MLPRRIDNSGGAGVFGRGSGSMGVEGYFRDE